MRQENSHLQMSLEVLGQNYSLLQGENAQKDDALSAERLKGEKVCGMECQGFFACSHDFNILDIWGAGFGTRKASWAYSWTQAVSIRIE